MVEEGVAKLREQGDRPFLIQSLRHLGNFEASRGRRDNAIRNLREAEAMARDDEALGQLRQIEAELKDLLTS